MTILTPFGENYRRRGGQEAGVEPCAHCGKAVKTPWRWFVEVIDGGAYVRINHNPVTLLAARGDGASYMGMYPVGPECRRVLQANGVLVRSFSEPTVGNEVI